MKSLLFSILLLPSLLMSVEITLSELDVSNERKRERAFEEWGPFSESQQRFEMNRRRNKFPIYSERKDGKTREIYIDRPDELKSRAWSGDGREALLKAHGEHTANGMVLLSLSSCNYRDGSKAYWGVWISRSFERKMLVHLRRYGISQAKISLF